MDAMSNNTEKICGPVTISLSNIRDGSVVFTATVGFLNGNADAVAAYKTALASDATAIFGNTYNVTVDTSSIADASVTNPSKSLHPNNVFSCLVSALASLLLLLKHSKAFYACSATGASSGAGAVKISLAGLVTAIVTVLLVAG